MFTALLDTAYDLAIAHRCPIEISGLPADAVPTAYMIEISSGDFRKALLTCGNGSAIQLVLI